MTPPSLRASSRTARHLTQRGCWAGAYAFCRRIAENAAFSLDAFLAEYGEDGGCPEGVHYYRHAALCLYTAIDLLNAVTDGAMASQFARPKLRNIAEYILYAHIDGDARPALRAY